jgi:hypothetical protein
MAEVSAKTVNGIIPIGTFSTGAWTTVVFVKGTKAAQNDILTVTGLTTVTGCYIQFASGAVETETFSTNVVTLTSATTGVVSGLVWGT